jgi:molecular chaperone DnaK
MPEPLLGIDLGTTFSAVAQWKEHGPEIMDGDGQGHDTTPSVFWWRATKDAAGHIVREEEIVGNVALNGIQRAPQSIARFVKREMGNSTQKIELTYDGLTKSFTPVEISAKILSAIYQAQVKKYPVGEFRSRGTVVTVPYHFKAHECNATRLAANLADINCIALLQEPVAASLAYAWQTMRQAPNRVSEETLLVFDLGGGTFDVTVFKLSQNQRNLKFEVLATGGDAGLGGVDFDELLVDLVLKNQKLSLDHLGAKERDAVHRRLMAKATAVKEGLSGAADDYFDATSLGYGIEDFGVSITRIEFEEAMERNLFRLQDIVENTLQAAQKTAKEVNRVVKVGGSSLIPSVVNLLERLFPNKIYGDINPRRAVAEGAALYAAFLDDPSIFGGEIEILTRTNHALGVRTAGGRFHKLVPANQPVPYSRSQIYTTTAEGDSFELEIYQGSQAIAKLNTLVGTLLTHLPVGYRQAQTKVEVTFKINEKNLLSVEIKIGDLISQAYITYQ